MPKLRLSNFYISSGLFTVLSLAGAVLNYSLYPILARILPPSSFGDFTAIMALSNQILAILLAFNITSIYLVKHNSEKEAQEKAQVIQKVLVWIFIAATLLVLLLSPFLNTKLKIGSPITFLILAAMLVTTIPAVIWTGYLQGHKRLVQVGVYAFSGALFKLIFAALFGALWGVVAALWGVLVGTVMAIFLLWLIAGVKLPKISSVLSPLTEVQKKFLRRLSNYVLQAILVVGGLGFLQNVDILFAKSFFNTDIAGVYSGVSILSNAIYYVAFLLVWIILPEIEPKNKIINKRVLNSAYKLLFLLAALTIITEFIFKDIITKILLGPEFAAQGQILIFATLYQISLVAVTLYAFYLLVLRSSRSLMLALAVIIPSVTFPWFLGDTPKNMIISLWASVLLGVFVYFIINIAMGSRRDYEQEIN